MIILDALCVLRIHVAEYFRPFFRFACPFTKEMETLMRSLSRLFEDENFSPSDEAQVHPEINEMCEGHAKGSDLVSSFRSTTYTVVCEART